MAALGDMEEGKDEGASRQFISALARGLDVLRAFRVGDPPLSNQELARRTGLPRPTISRIAFTLTELGYLSYHQGFGCYELGGGALVLGHVAQNNFNVVEKVRPLMQHLAQFSGMNVGLAHRDRFSMIYVDTVDGPSRIGLRISVGLRIPLLTTAMGRAYLAVAGDQELAQLARDMRRKKRIEEADGLSDIVDHARGDLARLGFCLSAGDWQNDIHGVAAPIRATGIGGALAINCGGPAYLLPTSELLSRVGPEVAETALKIGEVLGSARVGVSSGRSMRASRSRRGSGDAERHAVQRA
ncbi:MAG TPA: IclR family transcriptional regulator [Steroidobacteraceae bacterium]|nr:IclR family transcriptional regulator [Steroidobacteraceae bacterium]